MTITVTEYGNFQEAFDYFNQVLFAGQLPPCLITLQRKSHARGYYSAERFRHRSHNQTTDEIALNPATFQGRTDMAILSTLVHEMVHHFQRHFGTAGRGRYHNREWAKMMMDRGLMPSDTGEPGGKQTGDHVTHYIIDNGCFHRACQKLLDRGFKLNWQDQVQRGGGGGGGIYKKTMEIKRDKNRVKYTCLACGLNAWAKPDIHLICGVCYLKDQSLLIMRKLSKDTDL